MGSRPAQEQILIGEFPDQPTGTHTSLSCYLPKAASLSLIIQDEVGRARFNKTYHLQAGESEIEVGIASFSPGEYNAWIDVSEKTFIRSLSISNNGNEDSRGWFGKLFG